MALLIISLVMLSILELCFVLVMFDVESEDRKGLGTGAVFIGFAIVSIALAIAREIP